MTDPAKHILSAIWDGGLYTMKLTASYHGGTRYDVTSGKHRVITDQPEGDGGHDAGMGPVELFVGSVAACVGYFVGQFCERHNISREGLTIDAEWNMAERPHRVGHIDLVIHLPHRMTSEQKERMIRVAQGCTVHQSIAVSPTVSIQLNPQIHHGANKS